MISGIVVGKTRVEGIAAMEAQKWGRSRDVFFFQAPSLLPDVCGIVELT